MTKIREPAVAGAFYSEQSDPLCKILHQYLNDVETDANAPRTIIVPHAGCIYFGSIAAITITRLQSAKERINKVVGYGAYVIE